MGFIYKIWNEINDKLYIGQTTNSIEVRWYQHLKNVYLNDATIYRAMRKYGKEKFHIEKIEECDNNLLNEKEQYWIKFFNSKNNGYNSTIGGTNIIPTGKKNKLINNLLIQQLWDQGLSISDIKEKTGYSSTGIREHLLNYSNYSKEESIKRALEKSAKTRSKIIYQWNLEGKLIKKFDSQVSAEKETNIPAQNISKVLKNERQTAGGYYWTYNENPPILIKKQTQIYQYDKQNNLINIYKNKSEASKITGCDSSDIGRVCRGIRKTCGGYIWKEL